MKKTQATGVNEPQHEAHVISEDRPQNSNHTTEPSLGEYASLNVSPRAGTSHLCESTFSHTYSKLYQAPPKCACRGTQRVDTAGFYENIGQSNIVDGNVDKLENTDYFNIHPRTIKDNGDSLASSHSYEYMENENN